MTQKNSTAKLVYWASITPAKRSLILSQRRKKGWDRKTVAEKKAQGRKLTDVRLAKALKTKVSN